jgi:hypothetical protein
MLTKKHTAWKKSRKFGDIFGGRLKAKLTDNVFNTKHSLLAPKSSDETPIYILDNPSRDFYFPVTTDEVRLTLAKLPVEHTAHLTHIWFQKIKKADYLNGETFQGCFICGSGVYLIVLHPFPVDNRMRFGKIKPDNKIINYYKKYTTDLQKDEKGWFLKWTKESIKDYYLNDLLLHEIGHSVDSFYKRYWSAAGNAKREKFAGNFVAVWGNTVR